MTEIDGDYEQRICDYLENHRDFFIRHSNLAGKLEQQHKVGDGAVSLLQRRMNHLENKVAQYQKQLEDLVSVARENDSLNRRFHELILQLVAARSKDKLFETLLDDLREEFKADIVEIKLFSSETLEEAVNNGQAEPHLFHDFLQQRKPHCGLIKQQQMEYLFGESAKKTASIALIPLLGISVEGVLAIGSYDAQRFHPGKDTEFLQRLGELISETLVRLTADG